jgi:hypothetical protein
MCAFVIVWNILRNENFENKTICKRRSGWTRKITKLNILAFSTTLQLIRSAKYFSVVQMKIKSRNSVFVIVCISMSKCIKHVFFKTCCFKWFKTLYSPPFSLQNAWMKLPALFYRTLNFQRKKNYTNFYFQIPLYKDKSCRARCVIYLYF